MCCPSNSDNRNAPLGRRTHLRRTQYACPAQPGMAPELFNGHLRGQAPVPDRHHPFEHMRTLATYRVLSSRTCLITTPSPASRRPTPPGHFKTTPTNLNGGPNRQCTSLMGIAAARGFDATADRNII